MNGEGVNYIIPKIYCSFGCYWRHSPLHMKKNFAKGEGGKRSDLGGMYFRSRWEANWARYLNWRKARGEIRDWKFEPKTFEFPVKRGNRFYTPDFEITENSGYIFYQEIKGWMDPRSATKLRRMKKYYPEIRVDLIEKDFYRSAHRELKNLIPGWELPGSKHAF